MRRATVKPKIVCIEDRELDLLYLMYERVNGFGSRHSISIETIQQWKTGRRHCFVPYIHRDISFL